VTKFVNRGQPDNNATHRDFIARQIFLSGSPKWPYRGSICTIS